MPLGRIAGGDGLLELREKQSLAVELVIGVLREQPRMLSALLSYERDTGPSVFAHDRAQTIGVRNVHASGVHFLLEAHAAREQPSAGNVRMRWSSAAIAASSNANPGSTAGRYLTRAGRHTPRRHPDTGSDVGPRRPTSARAVPRSAEGPS